MAEWIQNLSSLPGETLTGAELKTTPEADVGEGLQILVLWEVKHLGEAQRHSTPLCGLEGMTLSDISTHFRACDSRNSRLNGSKSPSSLHLFNSILNKTV